jgi:LPS-assembly protein
MIATSNLPNLGLEYRRRFNFGEVAAEGSFGYLNGRENTPEGAGGGTSSRAATSRSTRTGGPASTTNWASSEDYLRVYRYGSRRLLDQNAFTEGFWGSNAYARIDGRAYQGACARPTTTA